MANSVSLPSVQPELAQVRVMCSGEWARASSILFLLPLWFPKSTYAQRKKQAVEATLTIGGKSVPFWEPFALSSRVLLPHVRRYLNIGGDGTTGTLLSVNPIIIDWLTGPREADSCWTLNLSNQGSLRFQLLQAHLFLYQLDIAFICLELRASSDLAADWFNLLHYVRFFTGDRARKIQVTTRELANVAEALRTLAAPSNAMISSKTKNLTVTLPSIASILDVLLDTVSLEGEPHFPLTQSIANVGPRAIEQPGVEGQLLTYPNLMFASHGNASANANLGLSLVSRAKGAHHAGQRISSHESVNATEGILPYAEDQWFFASSEGGGFVAIQSNEMVASPDPFQARTLPNHVRQDYFFAFSYSAFQRFALIRLSEEVASQTFKSTDKFTGVQGQVLEFTGRALFSQISQSQHHHRYYDLALRVHQVNEFHKEVSQEVNAFREYQQGVDRDRRERRSRKIQILLAVLTGIIIPSSVSAWPHLRHVSLNSETWIELVVAIILVIITTAWLLKGNRNLSTTSKKKARQDTKLKGK